MSAGPSLPELKDRQCTLDKMHGFSSVCDHSDPALHRFYIDELSDLMVDMLTDNWSTFQHMKADAF